MYLVHCVSNYGNGQIVESGLVSSRPISHVRETRMTENAKERKKKKKEEEQFVFRAMAAFCAVHIIYVFNLV